MQHILRTLPVMIALALGSGWAGAQTTGTGAGTGSQAGSTQPASKTGGPQEKLSRADRKFIEDAAKGGMFEVQSGQLAAQKASDPQVKEFADKLVQDHTKADDELRQIAQSKGVQLPDKEKWADRREMSKLQKLSGSQFDREFAQHEVKDHQKDIRDFEKAASRLKDPEVKAWADKTLPNLREHLALAQKLPEATGRGSKSSDTRAAGASGSKS